MKVMKYTRVGIILIFLLFIVFFGSGQFTYANQNNQMISDDYLQNQQNEQNNQDDTPAANKKDSKETAAVGLGPWEYIKMFLSLLFVLGLLIVVLKFINKKTLNYQQNSAVRNIGGLSVGSQKSVQLLHIGDSLYIIGVGDNVQLIKEIKDPEQIEQLLNYYNEKQALVSTTPYIAELLKKFTTKQNADTDNTDNPSKPITSNFSEIFKNRLSDIKKERRNELEKWKEKERDK